MNKQILFIPGLFALGILVGIAMMKYQDDSEEASDTISAAISILLLLFPVISRAFSFSEYPVPNHLRAVQYMCSHRSKELSLILFYLHIVGAFLSRLYRDARTFIYINRRF